MSGTDLTCRSPGRRNRARRRNARNGDLFAIRGRAAAPRSRRWMPVVGKAGPSTGAGKPAWPAVVRIARRARVRARKNRAVARPRGGPGSLLYRESAGAVPARLRDAVSPDGRPGDGLATQDPATQATQAQAVGTGGDLAGLSTGAARASVPGVSARWALQNLSRAACSSA